MPCGIQSYESFGVILFKSADYLQDLWDQIKSASSEDSKLQGMVESLEKMLHDSESKYQVSISEDVEEKT